MPPDPRLLVLYNGRCRLCRAFAWSLARLDRGRRMRLVPFADAEAEAALAVLPAAERYAAFHTRAGGRLRSATAAAREVLLCLPAGRAAVALGLHRAYPLIARHRRALGRLVPRLPVTRTPPR